MDFILFIWQKDEDVLKILFYGKQYWRGDIQYLMIEKDGEWDDDK